MATKAINRTGTIILNAGGAKPGANLASYGIDMVKFCREFNLKTEELKDDANPVPVPVFITAYKDKSFDYIIKTPPTTFLLKKAAKIAKGSANAATTTAGTITLEQVTEIAKIKQPDLNTYDLESAIKIVEGTAKNMGIKVSGRETK